ncbi:hypothetical protein CELL_01449 [Cellulomonas sp. T2.31MG-18]
MPARRPRDALRGGGRERRLPGVREPGLPGAPPARELQRQPVRRVRR